MPYYIYINGCPGGGRSLVATELRLMQAVMPRRRISQVRALRNIEVASAG
jgi:hypothetical protein